MKNRVVAIGLESVEPTLLEEMTAEGELPTVARLRSQGTYGRLQGPPHSVPDTAHVMLLTGQLPERVGGWTAGELTPQTYEVHATTWFDFRDCRPFYALGPDWRVATFDMSRVHNHPDVHGLQLSAWGARATLVPRESSPPEFLGEFLARHGDNPLSNDNDYACTEDAAALADLHARVLKSLDLRERALLDLLARGPWDLFFTALTEPHTAGHYFWPHDRCGAVLDSLGGREALRSVYRRSDQVLGRVWDALPADTTLAVFSLEGMRDGGTGLTSFVFLPELLFRHSFPWARGLELEPGERLPSPERQAGIKNWVMEMWHLRRRPSRLAEVPTRRLSRRWALRWCRWLRQSPPLDHPSTRTYLNWLPAMWYQPYWPFMKAFALPTDQDGLIRLNVRGREGQGIVAPCDYDRVCAELSELLLGLRDPRSGLPVVAEICRTRESPFEAGEGVPHPADLIAIWRPGTGNEIDSPRWGRLGPVPDNYLGEHTPHGFFAAAGPGVAAGSTFATGRSIDVAPTLLRLLGLDPAAFPGRVLVSRQSPTPAP